MGRSLAVWLCVGLLLLAAGVVLFDGLGPAAGRGVTAGHVRSGGLASLPALARGPVSGVLGRADRAFWVVGLRAVNSAQGFGVRFGRAGVALRSGRGRLSLRFAGFGRMDRVRGVEPAFPRASANRVSYARGGVSEWYVNGPLGLEQGFDVTARPAGGAPLALAIAVSPGASVRLGGAGALLSAGGVSVRYTGLSASDSSGRALPAWLAIVGGRLDLRVDDRGARYPLRIDPLMQQGPKLVGSGAVGSAGEGASVALSADGNTALVAGPRDNGGVGAAWVFTRSGSTWTQQGPKLVGSGALGNAFQGTSVALSGDANTALIGGSGDNVDVGAAWVFGRSGTTWKQRGPKLVGAGANGTSAQGASVALSADGNTALIGGPDDGGCLVPCRPFPVPGAAWVFIRSGTKWTQQGPKLVGSDAAGAASQGASVALSGDGNTALIGGPSDDAFPCGFFQCPSVGAGWVFTRSGATWAQQGPKLVGSDAAGASSQGSGVALSSDGNTALVGGPTDDNELGAAWVFGRSGTTWAQQGPKLVGSGAVGSAGEGASVALSADGNTALVGGPRDNGGVGAAWVNPPAASSVSPLPAVPSPPAPPPPAPPPQVPSSPMPAPAISGLRVSPRKVSIAGRKVRRGCVKPTKQNAHNKPCRLPIKVKVTYTLNRAATVTFTLMRQLPGRKVRGKCVQQSKSNKRKKLCWRFVPIHGSIAKAVQAGANGFTFNGWIGRHRLAPGTYRLTATPAGGQPQTVTLKIVT